MGQDELPEDLPRWLLIKYQNGTCTKEESRLVDAWFDHMDEVTSPEDAADLETIHTHVMQQVRSRKVRPVRLYVTAVVAALILLFTIFLVKSKSGRSTLAEGWIAVHTSPGELKKIVLPDSSSVLLNSSSHLRYRHNFTQQREVYLQGEAFFDITTDAIHPFHVQSDSLHVLVLGTRFNVAVYPNDCAAVIVLESGRVQVKSRVNNTTGTILLPGETLLYAGGGMQVKEADLESAFAWQKGLLLYKNIPLGDICKDLERRYGVSIRIMGEKLPATAYSYSSRRIPLPEVLKVLSKSGSGFQYSINHKEIVIR